MRFFVLAFLVFLVSGCESIEYEGRCSRYGFVPGTNAYANCLQQLDMSRENRMERRFDAPDYDYD